MDKYRLFFIWQDDKEEAWLGNLSSKGFRLDSVSFPFKYHFSEEQSKKYKYHLNSPKDPNTGIAAFNKYFQESGWEQVGRMNGWYYFRKEVSSAAAPEIEWGDASKADHYQKYMMALVGLLPLLLIIFPAIGRRFAPPLFEVLKATYFIFLALYTLITFKVYQRVNHLRDK
jgi:hypothetical protein